MKKVKKGLDLYWLLFVYSCMMIDDYILDGGYFEDKDTKLLNLSSHFGGLCWKGDNQLDKSFTRAAEKSQN